MVAVLGLVARRLAQVGRHDLSEVFLLAKYSLSPRRRRVRAPPSGVRDPAADQAWTLERVHALGMTTDLETAATILGIGRTLAYELAKNNLDLAALERQVSRDDDQGLFGDHLRRILVSLVRDPELCDFVRDIFRGRSCTDQKSFYRLRSGGVLLGDSAREARLRCQAYATLLERYLL